MRVGLDVDEVLAQLHRTWIADYNAVHGTSITEFTHWEQGSSPFFQALLVPSMYDRVLPYPGTIGCVDTLRRMGHSIFFVTSCGPNNETAFAKQRWLRQWGYMPEEEGLFSGHMIATQDKRNVDVDVLVDDHINNVESFRGWSILQNRPHNHRNTTNKLRIDHLSDFVEILWQQRTA